MSRPIDDGALFRLGLERNRVPQLIGLFTEP